MELVKVMESICLDIITLVSSLGIKEQITNIIRGDFFDYHSKLLLSKSLNHVLL